MRLLGPVLGPPGLRRAGLLEVPARLVGHEYERPLHFVVGEAGIPAARRHGTNALERALQQGFLATGDTRSPRGAIADLRRSGRAGRMARAACLLHHLLPGPLAL